MKKRVTVLSSILSETQFMNALRMELRNPELRKGISAVLRVRVNAHMATISRVGEHDAGSKLLVPAGRRLRQCVRSSDLVASSKPGIFLMLLRGLNSEDDLAAICERIIRAGRRPFQVASTQVYSGYNVGAAILTSEDVDASSLVSRATATMYQHNRYGEGGFDLFHDEDREEYSSPLAIESYISNALEKNLFELDFQPQYNAKGALIGAEAMTRMLTPAGQRLNGESFLPGVEERGLIVEVSERALGQLCFQAGDWLHRGIPIPSLSLAVADPHFLQEDFAKMVGVLLHNADIPGALLELEITEATIMTDLEAARRTLTELAALGVRLALRGMNMGSFLAVCSPRLPIDSLQVSCSPNALPSVGALPLLRAVISQGHRLGLRVTAKDIGSAEQMKELRAGGCDCFQGPVLADPLRRDKIEEVFLGWNSFLKEA
jgi:EAL domain-containing protein (putative c-di-GMP-specific phosphodiesterase class I)/GGDEF domain-containing protein